MPLRSSSIRTTDIPANDKVPQLHRYTAGGTLGGPIIKDKLFGFLSYQHMHVSDQEIGDSVPRRAGGLERRPIRRMPWRSVSNNSFCSASDQIGWILHASPQPRLIRPHWLCSTRLHFRANPASGSSPTTTLRRSRPPHAHIDNAFIPGTGRFTADMAVADLDYNATSKDTLASSTSTSTIPLSLPIPTPACRDSPSTSTPARRSSPSPTASSSNRT